MRWLSSFRLATLNGWMADVIGENRVRESFFFCLLLLLPRAISPPDWTREPWNIAPADDQIYETSQMFSQHFTGSSIVVHQGASVCVDRCAWIARQGMQPTLPIKTNRPPSIDPHTLFPFSINNRAHTDWLPNDRSVTWKTIHARFPSGSDVKEFTLAWNVTIGSESRFLFLNFNSWWWKVTSNRFASFVSFFSRQNSLIHRPQVTTS